MGNSYKSYDPNEDYKKKMDEAAANGDYASAAKYEQLRNEKIKTEGLTQYEQSNQYSKYLPSQKPTAPQSTWKGQMEQTLQQILGRKPFEYDVNGDALYKQYVDEYAKQGRLAMEDTMGQATALTGGYGNSYAQTVGQQVYQDYIGKANDRIPELYQLALQKYQTEGDAMLQNYSLMLDAQDREDSKYRSELSEYYTERDRLDALETQERDRAYSLALQMLQSGMMPSEGLLSASGVSVEDAQKMYGAYAVPSYSGGGGGGSQYSEDTLQAQQALKEAGYDIAVDGYWGPETQRAYEDYLTKRRDDGTEDDADSYTYENGYGYMTFSELMNVVRTSSEDEIKALLNGYEGELTDGQWAAIEAILEQRGIFG